MSRLCQFAIAIALAAFIGLQFAAIWHSAEHLHEGDGARHHCTLCQVKHQSSTLPVAPALAAVVALITFSFRRQGCSARLTAPITQLCCRGPPATD